MDRKIIYSGQLPRSADSLDFQKNAVKAIGQLAADVMTSASTLALITGLACTPTSPASMGVLLASGACYQQQQIDWVTPTSGGASLQPFGAASADSTSILLQGISAASQTITGFTAPAVAGQSINYLIEVQVQNQDGTPVTLPYYNSANPAVPLQGPAGAGTAQNTDRKTVLAVKVVAGSAAATGTQVTPGVDVGWVPAYVVTVTNGQSTILSGNIAVHSQAPFLGSLTSQHHTGKPGQAPKIDLTSEVQNVLPAGNIAALPVGNLQDLACSAGAGLNLNYNGAPNFDLGGTPTTIAAGSIALSASSTCYVFVNSSGVVAYNTTGWATDGSIFPMALVVTGAAAITSVTDKRGWTSAIPGLTAKPGPGTQRNTILAGKVDSQGRPALISFSGAALTLLATAVAAQLTFANGFDANGRPKDEAMVISADVSPAGWANFGAHKQVWPYVDRDPNTGAPTYGSTRHWRFVNALPAIESLTATPTIQYTMDNFSGGTGTSPATLVDEKAFQNATLGTGAKVVAGPYGRGLYFDGTANGYASTLFSPAYTTWTFAALVRFDSTGFGWFVGDDNSAASLTGARLVVGKDTNQNINVRIGNGTSNQIAAFTSYTVPLGVPVHVLVTVDGTNIKLYINGVFVQSVAQTFALPGTASAGKLTLGRLGDYTGANIFQGFMDEVRVYNTAVSATEAAEIYKAAQSSNGDHVVVLPDWKVYARQSNAWSQVQRQFPTLVTTDAAGSIASKSDQGIGREVIVGAINAPNNPRFLAYQTAGQSIAATTNTKLTFQATLVDTSGEFDTTTGRYTAKEAGARLFGANIVTSGGVTLNFQFYKNGQPYMPAGSAGGCTTFNSGPIPIDMQPGDYVEVYVFSSAAVNSVITGTNGFAASNFGTSFYCHKIA